MHVHLDIEQKNVLIIGRPASGKTFLSKLLAKDNPTHKVFHTDDYMEYGYKTALYALLKDLAKTKKPTIVEGVQGYRLLRKGVELDSYYPDIVVELEISDVRMYQTYKEQRKDKDVGALKGFNLSHAKILNDYRMMTNKNPPEWHTIANNY